MKIVLSIVLFSIFSFAVSLQEVIDSAKAGSKIELPQGIFNGNIVINKPLILTGQKDKTIIKGDGKGTVITINSSNVTIKNLTILNSGIEHERVDAGIAIKNARFCEISNCIIKDCLFGIDLQSVHNSKIINNFIQSKNFSLGIRGDGVRLWYSNDNLLKKNKLYKSRDFVVWYSHGNIIEENIGEYGRYSLHFMYAGKNIVRKNYYKHNSVGIFFMYSRDTEAYENTIISSLGTTGIGIGLKDATNFTIKNNTVLYCAKGFYIDRSPFEPDEHNYIQNNKILYNAIGMHFHSLSIDNIIQKNIFKGNIENTYDDSGANTIHSVRNKWAYNYWDDYAGFDKNKDNIGDTPYSQFYYADKMWLTNPNVRFFYASPVISILNFLAKLAPFSEPIRLLTDEKPLMNAKETL